MQSAWGTMHMQTTWRIMPGAHSGLTGQSLCRQERLQARPQRAMDDILLGRHNSHPSKRDSAMSRCASVAEAQSLWSGLRMACSCVMSQTLNSALLMPAAYEL